ncbi:hypothetical protein GCM10009007_03200 [Formosimonas limnophila]|uniref:C-type lysozyme inhibitor domain-containing protein n=1 Tax=Formosimonas limnophila TaxID=1384487 RepID=A0A8J3CJQ0_9BURK|nr:hypothetical protein [Formosimonas limnophila]GHA66110.1 hypothetical protein GCM10009007_03200 [Formosimonas limnophila]
MKKIALALCMFPLFAHAKPAQCVLSFSDENYDKYVACDVKPTDNKGSFLITRQNYKATLKVKNQNSATFTDSDGKRLSLYRDEENKSCWVEDVWPSTICIKK